MYDHDLVGTDDALAQLVLPHVGLEGRPVGVTRGNGSVAGVSLIVTLPGAERQPSHLDANVEDVYSVIVPLSSCGGYTSYRGKNRSCSGRATPSSSKRASCAMAATASDRAKT